MATEYNFDSTYQRNSREIKHNFLTNKSISMEYTFMFAPILIKEIEDNYYLYCMQNSRKGNLNKLNNNLEQIWSTPVGDTIENPSFEQVDTYHFRDLNVESNGMIEVLANYNPYNSYFSFIAFIVVDDQTGQKLSTNHSKKEDENENLMPLLADNQYHFYKSEQNVLKSICYNTWPSGIYDPNIPPVIQLAEFDEKCSLLSTKVLTDSVRNLSVQRCYYGEENLILISNNNTYKDGKGLFTIVKLNKKNEDFILKSVNTNHSFFHPCVKELSNGNIVAAGSLGEDLNGDNLKDYIVYYFDSNLNEQSTANISITKSLIEIKNFEFDDDGSIYATGVYRGEGIERFYLAKYNKLGEFLWEETWGGETHCVGYHSKFNSKGNLIYIGGTDDDKNSSASNREYYPTIIEIDVDAVFSNLVEDKEKVSNLGLIHYDNTTSMLKYLGSNESNIKVFNISGEQLFQCSSLDLGKYSLSSYSTGVYLVEISIGSEKKVEKTVKY